MALLFCDGFDHYTASSDSQKWDGQVYGISSTFTYGSDYGRESGGGIYTGQANRGRWHILDSTAQTLYQGVAIKIGSITVPGGLLSLWDGNTVQVCLCVETSQKLCVRRGKANDGTTLDTSTYVLARDRWYYIEWKVYIHDSAGTVDVRVNGSSVLALTSQDTQNTANAYADRCGVGNTLNWGSTAQITYDDYYCIDTTGSYCNDWLGDVRVPAHLPTDDGYYTEMTPSAGSNYECVDENPPNDDDDYVSEDTATEIDTYDHAAASATSGTIYAVVTWMYARKDDGGTRQIRAVARHSSTDGNGDTHTISDTYHFWPGIFYVNPSTSSAWTVSEFNAAEFGQEMIA